MSESSSQIGANEFWARAQLRDTETTSGIEMARRCAAVLDEFDRLVELAAGYRARLERAGFSPTMSEQLAGQWLSVMQVQALTGGRA